LKSNSEHTAGNGGGSPSEPIAITGLGGIFPNARTLDDYWRIISKGVDTSRPVPQGRWILNPAEIQNATPGAPDSVYTDRACFIEDFHLDPSGLLLPEGLAESLDPSVQLLLEAGRSAFASAQMAKVDRRRIGVILGNIILPTDASSALCEQFLAPIYEQRMAGDSRRPASETAGLNRYAGGLPAGVLAQALGLGGGCCTLDAACASSLYALKLACDELKAGRADAMLAGGVSRPDSLYTQMGFSQLRALAVSGRCTPFDAAGSGLIVGEGAGVLVLKRLSDALRDGDTIHALIRGIGLSNDLDGNLLSPASEGQLRALKIAYEQAGWTPDMVDMIECHATGTPVGDAVEFESLQKLWKDHTWTRGQCVLGAVKANIGHLLTAAGSAALIKVLLALKNGTLPATANFRQPSEKIPLGGSPFRILGESEPWRRRAGDEPRRAAINGFGFGGINAHVLVEEWTGQAAKRKAKPRRENPPCAVAIVGIATCVGPWTTLRSFQERVLGGGKDVPPAERDSWRDIATEEIRSVSGGEAPAFPGYYLGDLAIPLNRYRIPPRELGELLPQQALMLEMARRALADARLSKTEPSRSGVFIGLGLDLRTTDFHFRWAMLERTARWADELFGDDSGAEKAAWLRQAREGAGPALTADRTLGALAGTNASRIAKEFRFGGPSHTVCGEDSSGIRALEIAVRTLQRGELDQAVAGAVDLTGDLRTLLATHAVRPYSQSGTARPFDAAADGPVPGEGAVALVLKRLDDARRDGNRIYAVVRGIGVASGGGLGNDENAGEAHALALDRAYREAAVDPASIGYVEANAGGSPGEDRIEAETLASFFVTQKRETACRVGSAKADVGHAGAASGLVSIAKASLALYHEVVPPLRGLRQPLPGIAEAGKLLAPVSPQHWVRNRSSGPRRAGVSSLSVDGNAVHVVLEACEKANLESAAVERTQPLGARSEALFTFQGKDAGDLLSQIGRLRESAAVHQNKALEFVARQWHRAQGRGAVGQHSLALIAQDAAQLARLLDAAAAIVRDDVASPPAGDGRDRDRDRIFYSPRRQRIQGGIAFVFPGSGNHFADMGRELALQWPDITRAQDRENEFLASQLFVDKFWNATLGSGIAADHRALICGQVALGTLVSDLAVSFGIRPNAIIGYSLGESTGLFASRAWTARDDMLRRLGPSTLFTRDLVGNPEVLRRVWRVPAGEAVEWKTGLVDRPAGEVRAAIAGRKRIYVLIVNTPGECVIGGDAVEVKALVAKLGCHWFPVAGVSTVHCELLHPFEKAYRSLHVFETNAPAGVQFYSGGWGRAYTPDRDTAADAIVAQASGCIDFPKVIRTAYESGIRFFLEMGPGNSCTRMIGQILDGSPHLARSLCISAQEPVLAVLRVLGALVAEGVPVDLSMLYGGPDLEEAGDEAGGDSKVVRIPITGAPLLPPSPPATREIFSTGSREPMGIPALSLAAEGSAVTVPMECGEAAMDPFETEVFAAMARAESATLEAHQAYLGFSRGVVDSISRGVEAQLGWISAHAASGGAGVGNGGGMPAVLESPSPIPATPEGPLALDRAACLEFARGLVSNVLGPDFNEVDSFPTRVRLPDEPLMLVDRILEVHGEARSMTHGRVVTEHDILPGAWYLDGGCIPTCIAVEAGQADLFLSGYLGIDFEARGLAVYRLLDARVCFHQGLPGPGSVIHYDIRIERFFRQGNTWLFRFNFEATVDGQPLLTMTDGCAGFFTATELAEGRGIVRPAIDEKAMPGKRPADWEDFTPMGVESFSADQLEALRRGDLAGCFGPTFAGLAFRRPATLPGGQMKLVHRIPHLDPRGGRFGMGLIRGEADIHPTDWFLTCHFVDDRVMPGTLMFECCLHTLRVFLLRMGWIAEQDAVRLEPVPKVVSQLKCRGQVLESTKTVTYEVSIKELGYGPEPYVIADALMYADGKPIVEIINMSLRYAGASREMFRETWTASKTAPLKRAIFDRESILAFAIGKPSDAFGEPYRIFDSGRIIARLPGPPYQFLDRITGLQAEAFKMVPGGVAEAEYDIPADAWYFTENRQGDMPFAVLLEIALQPCGWLAAYIGSALTSDVDVSFRNLGGQGTQFAPVWPATGTLTTRTKITRVSSSAGMIIQWFDFEVRAGTAVIYRGDTYFGFFPKAALAKQEGIQNAKLYAPNAGELAGARSLVYPRQSPYPGDQLRMVDDITAFVPDGGPNCLGFIRATKRVNPGEWFFKAHFFQDPVVPGSLGLESFLQLLKFAAIQRWGHAEGSRWEAVATGERHEWTYRGQVIPADHLVTVEAVVTAVNDGTQQLSGDGFLSVDGRVIYSMKDFTVRRQAG
jgi:acyl transferase domain-containing protein/3-hydroxymyristoyl/3-hydroxydecanoyl-(acyl carrier protein) dehydratase